MHGSQFLAELAELGVKLAVVDGQLKIKAPKGVLTAELKQRLAAAKSDILDALSTRAGRGDSTRLPQIVPDPDRRFEPFPLTDIQQAYWIGSQSDFDMGNVDIHIYTEIDAQDLDLPGLQRALNQTIARHDMLRAVVEKNGEQRILAEVPEYVIVLTDLSGHAAEQQQVQLAATREHMSHGHRDHAVWPGFEVTATKLDARRTRLHCSFDLLHIDGGSLQLMFSDLAAFYRDPALELTPFTLSYRDYVLAEQALQETEMYRESLDYWRRRVADLPAAPQLTLKRELAAGEKPRFNHGSAVLEAEHWSAIKAQIRRRGFSPPAVLLTAFAEALSAWSAEADLTVNVTMFNRLPMHPRINDILGDFTSMVLLGMRHEQKDPFAERVRRVQETLWSAFEHRHVSGVQVLRELARVRGSRSGALMPVVFTSFLNLDDGSSSAPSSALRELGDIVFSISQTPQVWLDHQVIEDGGNLLLSYDSVEQIFPPDMIAQLFAGYRRLLTQLARGETWDRPPRDLIDPAQLEQRRLINQTEAPIPEATLYDLFCDSAAALPGQPAVVTESFRLTYGELQRRANRLGHWLQKHGTAPDHLVAVVMDKGWEQILAVLGIHAAGGAYVPIDPELPPERLQHLLRDGNIRVVLTQRKLEARLEWPHGLILLALDSERETAALPESCEQRPPGAAGPRHLAYVLYTSGSTGVPKGVMIEHRAVVNRMGDIIERFDIDRRDRLLSVTALHHDLSVFDVFGVLSAGATLILPRANLRLDPAHWCTWLLRERVTLWNSVPTFLNMLVSHLEGLPEDAPRPDSLRWAILAGDWIPLDLPARLRDQVGALRFIASGGPTETTIWDIWNEVDQVDPDWKSIPYGQPLRNARYHILDAAGRPCPNWVPGEMCIGGAGLARGYWRNEEASRAFYEDPLTGERYYRSGDLGRWLPNGQIEILGRKDFQVKIRGMRIELGEIESAIRKHAQVREVVVVQVGERFGDSLLVAYLVGETEGEPDLEALRNFLADRLPPYMVPAAVVHLDTLPLGRTGKVDRAALPSPDRAVGKGPVAAFVAPRNEMEERVAQIWRNALDLEELSVEANLIDLGVNSLTALQVNGLLQETFGVALPLRLLLEAPTVAGLAHAIHEMEREAGAAFQYPTITPDPAARHEPFPLNPIQQAYWMGRLDTFELGNVAAQYYLEFEILNADLERVNRAWRKVIDRHDMLRVIIHADGNQQILAQVPPYEVELADMRAWPEADQTRERDALRQRMAHQVMATDQWPLFEFRATRIDDQVRFHFSLDLLIADAWSAQILFDDFRRFMEDPHLEPEPLELSFRDYLLADAALADSAPLQAARAYWRDRLDSLPPAPSLPLVMNPADLDKPRFVRRVHRIEGERWSRIKAHATEAGFTPSGLLLTVFGEVLARFGRQQALTLNATTFRRLPLHSEVQAIVGDFTSLTLLAIDCRTDLSLVERAQAVQEQLWSDLDHRAVSGIEVLRDLARRQGRKPGALMPVVFTSLLTRYEGEQSEGDGEQADYQEVFALSQTPQVQLDHQVVERGDALVLNWDAVEDLFPAGLLDSMFALYTGYLEVLAVNKGLWQERSGLDAALAASDDPRFTAFRQALLPLKAANQTAGLTSNATLLDLFERQADAAPDRPAILAGERALSYADVTAQSRRIGHWLLAQAVQTGERVAVILEKSAAQLTAAMGALQAGAAYLPIDPEWPKERRDHILVQSEVRFILTDQRQQDHQDFSGYEVLAVDSAEPNKYATTPINRSTRPDDLAYVIFTSGSTGLPKGVAIEHRGAVNTILDINRRWQVGPADRVFGLSALTFDLSVYDLFGALAAGAAVVVPEPWAARDPGRWLELMNRHQVSIWNSVPALMELLCEYSDNLPGTDAGDWPASLRLAMLSGDWLPLSIADRVRDRVPSCRVVSLGGATEASIWSIFYEIDRVDPAWKSIPYGKPLANQSFYVLNSRMELCPPHVPGELYIGGLGLARAYLGDKDKTKAAFVRYEGVKNDAGPEPGERLYRTGDWGVYRTDGIIDFLGREDTQVKVQGYRIELGEIETVLARAAGVASAVALAVGPPQGQRRLAAFVVPAEGAELQPEALKQHAAAHLAPYMVPPHIQLIDNLPLTANGKVDRGRLAEQAEHGGGAGDLLTARTPLEAELAELWGELLEKETVAVDQTLFDLGGNSLIAIRLLALLQERFGVEVGLQALFAAPTVAGLAAVIGQLKADQGETGAAGADLSQLQLVHQPEQRYEAFPLSDIQQAYLLGRMSQLELGNVAAHAYFEIEVAHGDPHRIVSAWKRLIDRHDMLRAVFSEDGTQRVLETVPEYEIPVIDLSDHSDIAREATLQNLRDELSHQVLPADTWPLFDLRITTFADGRMRIHISFDLLAADAWSSQILFLELWTLAEHPQTVLPPLTTTFRDYMQALETLPQTAVYARDRRYWQQRLENLGPAPALPLVVDPSTIDQPTFQRRAARLDRAVWSRIKERASRAGITPSGLCLAVYAEVLACWSTTPRFTLNVTTFNRFPIHEEIQALVGDFTSLSLLAVEPQRGDFEMRCRAVQEQLWRDLDHRTYSGVQVMRDWARLLGRAPGALLPVVFTSRLFSAGGPLGERDEEQAVPGGEVVFSVSQTPQVWLDMQVGEEGGDLTWTWDAVEALFPDQLLDAMFAAYASILNRLGEDESWWHAATMDLVPAEVAKEVARVNATHADFARGDLYSLFAEVAQRQPTAPAVLSERRSLTYRDLQQEANALCLQLRERGVKPGDNVAVVMEKGWRQAVATLAILQNGAAYVPIDPSWPKARVAMILEDCGATVVLTQPQWLEAAAALPAEHHLVVEEPRGLRDDAVTAAAVDEHDLAYIIFTSGTTGRPKGVAIEHRAVVNTLQDMRARFDMRADDRVFGLSALTFDLSVYDFFGTWLAGAAVVLPEEQERREPRAWSRLCKHYDVTIWNSVPQLLEMLLEHAGDDVDELPAGLRLALLSGDWLPTDIGSRLQQRVPAAKVISLGGATEAAIWSILYPLEEGFEGWNSVPYGRPMANQTMHVLDDDLRERPPWVTGELYIGGVGLARAYTADLEKTAASFVTHPRTGVRLYRTGDLGRRRPGGLIEFLGRRDFQVKIGGFRIELGEVEAALAKAPGVGAVVVEAVGDPRGNRRLVGYLVAADPEQTPDHDVVGAFLTDYLPPYMIPAVLVDLDSLPLTANGKLDRKALPVPEALQQDDAALKRPRTPVEKQLAAIWCELLGLERVSVDDGLFALGGNSLIAIRMVAMMQEQLNVNLELRHLFETPTIGELAATVARLRLEGADEEHAPEELKLETDPAGRFEPFPLNEVQQAYWLGRRQGLELGGVAAHSYTELESETLDPERIQAVWRRLIERHDMLRAVIAETGEQRVLDPAELPLFTIPVNDLSNSSESERTAALKAVRDQMSHQVLDTTTWPLFEIRISRLSPQKIRIHYSFDLLISDAWSSQLLILEFAYLYAKPDAEMPPLAVTFRDYTLAMENKAFSSRYRRDRTYWRRRLETLPPAPELPLEKDPATLTTPTFVRRFGHLNRDDWQALQQQATRLGITPSGLLMAAYAEALSTWSRQPHFCLNVTTFNRMPLHADINNVVGDFTSLTLLEVDTSPAGGESFAQRARGVQEQLWADLDHRTYSGVEVIRDLGRVRGQAPGALMPVVFTSRLFRDPSVAKESGADDFPYGEVVYSVSQTPQVWLDAQVQEEDGVLKWSWDVVEDLFPAKMIDRLFDAHTSLLERLAREALVWQDKALSLCPRVDTAVYHETNRTDHDFGAVAVLTMDQLVGRTVTAKPKRPALITPTRTLTYAELWQAAGSMAHKLLTYAPQPNQLVAVLLPKDWQQAVAVLAVQRCGAAYLPINPEWPHERRDKILDQAGVTLVLADQDAAAMALPEGVTLHQVGDADFAGTGDNLPDYATDCDDLAYVIFTSGSTGTPKGVAIEHRGAVNTLLDINRRYGITPDDRVLALSNLTFDLSVYDLFGIWAAGGATVLPPAEAYRDPLVWSELGHQHEITLWNSVPALLDMMLTFAETHPGAVPATLRLAMLSGDWLPVDIADRLQAARPSAATVSMGGATEASIWSIYFPVPTPTPDWASVPYGKPLANQTFHVLDSHMRARPFFVPGELYIGGVGLAREYYRDEERTAASFVIDPHSGARLYRTGDMGRYLPDGNIEFLGREDNQVKVQGFRIELGEIEAALARYPRINAAVAAAPYLSAGSKARRLVAYIVPQDGDPIDQDHLRGFLAELIPDYMIPATYIELDSIPLTANGKVDRGALPDPGAAVDAELSAPRTPTEERLCGIWADLLGVDKVGIDDNLFDLGGTSVVAIQLLNAIREHFAMELSMRTLFENLTVRTLALAMSRARATGEAKLVSELPTLRADLANRYEPFPLNDIQQAYWVGRMGAFGMGEVSAHYYVEVESDRLNLEGFVFALRAMIQRHDALRLVFNSEGFQRILDPAKLDPYQVVVDDLRNESEAERDRVLMATRARMSHHVLPPEVWPLFEVKASRLSDSRYRLHLSFDLLLADAWSFQLLFGEMTELARDPQKQLAPLEISFRDYVVAEQKMRETDRYQRSESYWRDRIQTLPMAPDLPLRRNADVGKAHFNRYDGVVPAEQWQALQDTAAALGVTPTGMLMAAFSEVLAAWSRDPRFTLNVTMFNRMPLHPQVNMLLGDFTSMTLVAVDTTPSQEDDCFALRARATQERIWTDLDHGDYGGVRVLRDLQRARGRAGAVAMPIVFTSRLFKIRGFQGGGEDHIGDIVYSISQTPQVWIDHQLTERDGALCYNWDVIDQIFPPGLIDDMFAAYHGLLTDLAQHPERWHEPVPDLVPVKEHAIFHRLNQRALGDPAASANLVGDLFQRLLEDVGQPAITVDGRDGVVSLNRRDFIQRVDAVRAVLVERKIGPGSHVALMVQSPLAAVVSLMGAFAAGATVALIDAAFPAARRREYLERAEPGLILGEIQTEALCRESAETTPLLLVDWIAPSTSPVDAAAVGSWPSQTAGLMVLQTAGDGQIVAVPLPQNTLAQSFVSLPEAAAVSGGAVLATVPTAQSRCAVHVLWTLSNGGELVLPRQDRLQDADYLFPLTARVGVDTVIGEAAVVERLLNEATARDNSLPKNWMFDGEAPSIELWQRLYQQAAGTRVFYLAGAVETGFWSHCFDRAELNPECAVVPYGRPLAGRQMLVLDKQGRIRPTWVPGDLYMGGAAIASGYHGDEQRSKRFFMEVPDPFGKGPVEDRPRLRLFRTGLVVRRLPSGDLEYIDRDDSPVSVPTGSFRYHETEAILRAYPGVVEAVCAALPPRDAVPGDVRKRLVAYVVGKQNQTPAMPPQGPPDGGARDGAMPRMPDPEALYKTLSFEPVFTPLERLQFKMERRGLRSDRGDRDGVALNPPAQDESERAKWIHRTSRRRFLADQPVALTDLSHLLELLRALQPDGVALPKYRYPSGGGLYPVQTYVAVAPNRVQGLAAGLYYYHPFEHHLSLLDNRPVPTTIHAPENRPIADPAAFTLLMVGNLEAVSPLYPEMGRDFCVLEAGYMSQLLMEHTPPAIGLCPLGGLAFGEIRDRFALADSDDLVHVLVGGSVAPAADNLREAFLREQLDSKDFNQMTERKAVVTTAPQPGQSGGDGDHWALVRPPQPDWHEQALFDPVGRLQFKLEKRAVRNDETLAQHTVLQRLPVEELEPAWAKRRSYRHFLAEPVPMERFAALLACLRSLQPEGTPLPKYRYPSGGGLYPVQTYLHVKKDGVVGLDAGTYYFDPVACRLCLLHAGADIETERHGLPNRPIADEAVFTLCLVGKFAAVAPLYPGLARDFCLLEAGYMAQLLCETATDLELGLTPLGGLDFVPVRPLFDLDDDADLVHVLVGGAVSPMVTTIREAMDEGTQKPPEAKVDAHGLRHYLSDRLPEPLVPTRYVLLDSLPKDDNGRVDRAALPDPDAMREEAVFEEPANEHEQRIASIWQSVLGLEAVDVARNFFEMGGTSVQMVQLQGRLQEQFERNVPLTELFEYPTIRTQAKYFSAETQTLDLDETKRQADQRKAARKRRNRRER
ncbi:non-ribosomal peptide synthetase [Acanthopleuribacter pedis]|uniref:L-cysteine--[L-cysteinyl-carrier protein] ligase n=1 Tax=Acanthopleuribacter pedis TaxID=442870 RepID=A0A8J7Q3K6_9BACT|nr:non-ribosomal peptide synthetase [Acanthopleuribacter pedis]MBO1317724.1 amino acid adenylation domain-containing protein [Acanthopleuribacter pedis]